MAFLAVLPGTKRMSLSCIARSVALAVRIFFKLTGISWRPCAVVRMSFADPSLRADWCPGPGRSPAGS